MNYKEQEFEPFGEEWQKEMMKATKPMLIEMFKKSQSKLTTLRKLIEDAPRFYSVKNLLGKPEIYVGKEIAHVIAMENDENVLKVALLELPTDSAKDGE